jgi:hypothetical protein
METLAKLTIEIPTILLRKLRKYADRDGYTLEQLILSELEIRCFREENI